MKEGDPGVVRVIRKPVKRPDPPCTRPADLTPHADGEHVHVPKLAKFFYLTRRRFVEAGAVPEGVGAVELTSERAEKEVTKLVRIYAKQPETTGKDVRAYETWLRPTPACVVMIDEPCSADDSTPWLR